MLSALILTRRGYPAVLLAEQPVNRRSVQHGPLVLVPEPRKFPAPTIDRDRTVSRRSEPSSRATLMGEQRTTGSLCPSFLPVRHVCLTVKHPSAITFIGRLPIGPRVPLGASVTLLEATTPVKLPAKQCPYNTQVRDQTGTGPYFNGGSTDTGVPTSQPPAYPTQRMPGHNVKL